MTACSQITTKCSVNSMLTSATDPNVEG